MIRNTQPHTHCAIDVRLIVLEMLELVLEVSGLWKNKMKSTHARGDLNPDGPHKAGALFMLRAL